jgi:hypothetical protein
VSSAQVRQSPTPIIVNLFTPTPFVNEQVVATVTPTFTPTEKGPVLLEVRESAGNVNVRSEPDPNSDRLGGIEFGTQYPALRKYYDWYEFQYDLSPTGRAWVYGELVDIIGDAVEIEVIDTLEEPTSAFNPEVQQTETALAITSIPGGIETATAQARVLSVPTGVDGGDSQAINLTPYPTFTYPPDASINMQINSEDSFDEIVDLAPVGSLPPVFPILMLGGFGLLGMLVASMRR